MRSRPTASILTALVLLGGACSDSENSDDSGDVAEPSAGEPADVVDDAAIVWPGESDAEQTVELGAGLVAELPETWTVSPFDTAGDCETAQAALATGAGSVSLALAPAGCAEIDIGSIGNGYHGEYLSVDEVAEPLNVEEHDVAAGSLVTFSQPYFECTNECTDHDDHVGLLSLDAPADPDRPTLMLLDAKGEFPMDGLVAVAEAIQTGG